VPRVSDCQREARDALVLDLYLAGESLRAIGRHPAVGLSCRGVELAVKRGLAAMDVEDLEARVADAYQRACAGDERAGVQLRRLLTALGRHEDQEAVAGEAAADDDEARRRGELWVPLGTPSGLVASLARERAATLVAEGEAVGDVRLEGSRTYDLDVEWRFSFTVTAEGK
jgi:hypothetical protein